MLLARHTGSASGIARESVLIGRARLRVTTECGDKVKCALDSKGMRRRTSHLAEFL
jgi:hypothetical protein